MFAKTILTDLEKVNATQISLPLGSRLVVGGHLINQKTQLLLNTGTTGLGGLDSGVIAASTFYYVYLVVSSGTVGLVTSTSKIKPSGFNAYKKVGAFYTDGSGDVFKVYFFSEINKTNFSTGFDCSQVVSPIPISSEDIIGAITATRNATGDFRGTINIPLIVVPVIQASVSQNELGVGSRGTVIREKTTSTFRFDVNRFSDNGFENLDVDITVFKQGIDAVEPDWNLY
jgi:hypothetical protein